MCHFLFFGFPVLQNKIQNGCQFGELLRCNLSGTHLGDNSIEGKFTWEKKKERKNATHLKFIEKKPQPVHFDLAAYEPMRCDFEGPLQSKITWYFNDQEIASSSEIKIDDKQNSLDICYPSFKYTGIYKCVVSYSDKRISRVFNATINTQGPPEIFTNSGKAEHIRFKNAEHFCLATGELPLTYRWQKDGKPIPRRPFQPSLLTNGNTLRLNYLSLTDAGNYTCTVTNRLGSEMESSVLKVPQSKQLDYPPDYNYVRFNDGPDNTIAELNSSATLQCIVDVDSDKYSGFRWHHKSLINSQNASIVYGVNINITKTVIGKFLVSRLHISPVKDSNYGFYTCIYWNNWEGLEVEYEKYVTLKKWPHKYGEGDMKPKFPFKLKDFVLALPGIEKVLQCPAYGKEPLTYRWYKDEQELQSKTSEFFLKNPDPCHNGEYKCEASNKFGTISHVFTLHVAGEPRSKPTLEVTNTTVQLGSNATMTCANKVFKNIQILDWLKLASTPQNFDVGIPGNTFISKDLQADYPLLEHKYEIMENVANVQIRSHLKIINTTKSDLGWYACCGDNKFGMNCSFAYLRQV